MAQRLNLGLAFFMIAPLCRRSQPEDRRSRSTSPGDLARHLRQPRRSALDRDRNRPETAAFARKRAGPAVRIHLAPPTSLTLHGFPRGTLAPKIREWAR